MKIEKKKIIITCKSAIVYRKNKMIINYLVVYLIKNKKRYMIDDLDNITNDIILDKHC